MSGRRYFSNPFFTAALLLALAIGVDITQASTRAAVPPLFRESPNERSLQQLPFEPTANEGTYRLPNNTEPIHYNVELWTDVHDEGKQPFKGVVQIHLKAVEDTKTIVVHARQLSNFVATIKSADDQNADAKTLKYSEDKDREFLTLEADFTLGKDTNWILTINYEGQLRKDNGGFYLSSYADNFGKTRYLATTQFESTDARHGFPCYDEPAKRATFTISIHHDKSYNAISNMPVDEDLSKVGYTVFQKTPSMPTYLVAYIVSDFEYSEGVLHALKQRVYAHPGTQEDQEFALVSGMMIVQRLADYYGVEFSLPKLDQVAVPDFAAGAMENWGLVTYREEYLLYNSKRSTVNTQTSIASIIAHEYTHQWFGNLVAVKFWTFLWLKEGFATLFAYRGMDDAYPEWDAYQLMHTDEYQRALTSDAFPASRPMTHYVEKPLEIGRLYDSISYSKAGSVLYMWQQALTDRVFQRGLHNYLTRNRESAAEEWQLFVALQDAAKEEDYAVPARIEDMMTTWTRQGGYPLLTVERNYKDNSFTITQMQFLDNETLTSDKMWYVPVNYAHQANMDFRNTEATHYLKNEKEIKITDKDLKDDDWLILNKQSSGYYRVNYDERNWQLISNGLSVRPHKIHPRNRAQLMHDAYKFSTTNRLKHSILLDMMTYLEKEDQYAPWSTAYSILNTFNRYLSGDKNYNLFKNYILRLVSPAFDKFGVNDIPGEQHLRKFTRNVVINLACLAGNADCLKETNNKLKNLIENNVEIEPNLQAPTYCNGLRQSGNKEFNFVYDKMVNSEDQAQRRFLISSLGCAQSETELKKFVESSIDEDKLRTQERTTILSSAYSRGEVGLLVSIDFLNERWEEYEKLSPGFGGGNPLVADLIGMSQYANNEKQEKALLDLVAKIKSNSEAVTDNVETSIKTNIKTNFNWLDNNRAPVMNWIDSYFSGGVSHHSGSLLTICGALVVIFSRYL